MTDGQQGNAPEGTEPDLGKPLEQMTKAELYELATELEIVGRKAMNRDELEAAVRERQAFNEKQGDGSEEGDNEPSEEEIDGEESEDGDEELPPETQPGPSLPDPEPTAPLAPTEAPPPEGPTLAATHEQLQRISQADTAKLKGVLDDPELPDYLRAPVIAELDRRAAEAKKLKANAALKSKVEQYRVTKGGRYVVNGYITTLPVDSVINPTTHNLQAVSEQGIEFVPLTESRMVEDQLGVPKHIVR